MASLITRAARYQRAKTDMPSRNGFGADSDLAMAFTDGRRQK